MTGPEDHFRLLRRPRREICSESTHPSRAAAGAPDACTLERPKRRLCTWVHPVGLRGQGCHRVSLSLAAGYMSILAKHQDAAALSVRPNCPSLAPTPAPRPQSPTRAHPAQRAQRAHAKVNLSLKCNRSGGKLGLKSLPSPSSPSPPASSGTTGSSES